MTVPPVSNHTAAPGTATLNSTYLCTANVVIGKKLDPIPLLEGGLRIVEPITSGSIHGPGFNATIEGGFAAPIVVLDGNSKETKSQKPFIYVYGHADDGSPFYIEELGFGPGLVQNTRAIIQVGGKYQGLQSLYVLGQVSINEDRTAASAELFSVPLPTE
ncbi:hypothetical protein DL770_009962 [Monosporascus sp. CRB-9-2]|nr:hypothetical protein DL770_009962 [Monosporascus sp. CRB-9-2]